LHGAREEARLIAPLYRTTSLLAGVDATPIRLGSEVAAAEVLHIAAHVLVDGVDGAHSRLLLAGDQADASLFSRDIDRLPLEHTRTVILAGCGTAAADHRPHAPTAMATQFLASGPEEVAGMLWDLDDAVAARFFARVHEGVAAGRALVDAVRQAQLQQIDEDRRHDTQHSLPTWANVVVYGLIPLSRSDDATSG
jgi:CHAT domain-containing protein